MSLRAAATPAYAEQLLRNRTPDPMLTAACANPAAANSPECGACWTQYEEALIQLLNNVTSALSCITSST